MAITTSGSLTPLTPPGNVINVPTRQSGNLFPGIKKLSNTPLRVNMSDVQTAFIMNAVSHPPDVKSNDPPTWMANLLKLGKKGRQRHTLSYINASPSGNTGPESIPSCSAPCPTGEMRLTGIPAYLLTWSDILSTFVTVCRNDSGSHARRYTVCLSDEFRSDPDTRCPPHTVKNPVNTEYLTGNSWRFVAMNGTRPDGSVDEGACLGGPSGRRLRISEAALYLRVSGQKDDSGTKIVLDVSSSEGSTADTTIRLHLGQDHTQPVSVTQTSKVTTDPDPRMNDFIQWLMSAAVGNLPSG